MKVMLNTLDDNQPKWQLENSIIGTNPGLGYRPMSENETERGSVIKFNKAKGENTFWVKLLDNFLECKYFYNFF